jgi:non-ribosomal peptide synthetase component F
VFAATRAARKSSVPNADETIGLFINTVPVRVQIKDDDALISVFKNVRKLWLDIRPYEHTPLARVKAVSQVPPSQPLFETLFVFENYRLDTAMRALGGEWSKRQVELHELTNFPITLAAYDGEELAFKIEFDRRRLEDATIRRMLGHLRQLLEVIAQNPNASVGAVRLLTVAERKELVEDYNPVAQANVGSNLPLGWRRHAASIVRTASCAATRGRGANVRWRVAYLCTGQCASESYRTPFDRIRSEARDVGWAMSRSHQ